MKQRPLIMGVLNLTPDSFSDGGRFDSVEAGLAQAKLMVEQGANIIDVGGESTRPGADRVPLEVEQQRVLPMIEAIVAADWFAASDVKISIDTMNSSTAVKAVAAGASIVNDVSGGLADPNMHRAVAGTDAKYVVSHWRGFSKDMNTYAEYEDVAKDVAAELAEQVAVAVANGIARDRIVIDPGLGFSKDQAQNWQLVARLDELDKLGLPVLVGASRKRFIAGVLDAEAGAEVSNERRDVATAVLTALIMQRRLWGVRVHNVQATADAMAMVEALEVATPKSKRQS